MNDSTHTINLDFNSSLAHFHRSIQNQLDVIRFLYTGAQSSSENHAELMWFYNISLASDSRLSHDEVRNKALEWLATSFMRDAIEATDLFLGRCLSFCSTIELGGDGEISAQQLDYVFNIQPRIHHKLHFPSKISTLKDKYGVTPKYSTHVVSFNKLRTCLVHRLGRVSNLDLNDEKCLKAKWLTCQMELHGIETGAKLILTEPGQGLDEESSLVMNVVEYQKSFQLGDVVSLSPHDIFSTIYTLYQFGLSCAEEIKQFAIKSGVPVHP